MFNSISFYIILTLSGLLSISAYLNYHQIKQIASLKVAQDSYVKALESSQKQLETKGESCKIDDTSVVELDREKKSITAQSESIDKQLIDLKQQATVKVVAKSKEIIKNETKYLPDDGLLSPKLSGLLKQSFCASEPTDPTCVSP